ncbi:MAG: DNA primase [Ignavibacteria bacterium]|nr:DNA primase [Ignavibacteria bacterium]
MQIQKEKFDEIAIANDIVSVISDYIEVKKRGKSFLALCPFHPDKNPSLHISQEKQVYHCFSCKSSGNVYTFVQNYEKITFIEAAEKLAAKAGIDFRKNYNDPDLSNEISKILEINKIAAKYFNENLGKISGSERDFVYKYLENRKIDSELIKKFGIGYAGSSWDGLLNYFSEDDVFKKEDIEKAGLIIRNDKDKNKFYDRFRRRLIFPIINESGKVAGFGGRKLFEDDPLGKYINSPESKVYSKSKILYGLNFAKDKIRYFDYVILVEGYMDIVSLAKFGIENTVASSGTALTEEQVKLISRYTKNIYILFDSDFAGIKAAKRGIEIILEAGLDLFVISLPEGEDPDSFINKYGKSEFEKYLHNKKSVINFISELYSKEGKLETVNDKTEFVKEIIGLIGKIPDSIKRAFYIKEIARMYSLYESDLRDELEKVIKENKSRAFPKSSVVLPERKTSTGKESDNYKNILPIEKELIELFINGKEEAISYLENNLEICFIKNKMILKLTEFFLDEYINHGKIELTRALNELEDEEERIFVTKAAIVRHEASLPKNHGKDSIITGSLHQEYNLKSAKDLIKRFRVYQLEEKRSEMKKNPELMSEIFEITKQINELRKISDN